MVQTTSGAFKDFKRTLCLWSSTLTGTANFVVGDPQPGKFTPEQAQVFDGHSYDYYAQAADGSQWEAGNGQYDVLTHTLHRTTIVANSDGTLLPVNFTATPLVGVLANPDSTIEPGFPSGTLMLFQQATAPSGWTRQTTHNDKALRVVDGSSGVSSGGSNSFSTVMAQTTVGNHTLTTAELAAHPHPIPTVDICTVGATKGFSPTTNTLTTLVNTNNAGGGSAHNHPITMSIRYVDLIICAKV